MGTIIVDVDVLINGRLVRMFKNVKIRVEETSNRKMEKAFEEQHPVLLKRIPTHTEVVNGIGTTVKYRCAFSCKPHHDSWKD